MGCSSSSFSDARNRRRPSGMFAKEHSSRSPKKVKASPDSTISSTTSTSCGDTIRLHNRQNDLHAHRQYVRGACRQPAAAASSRVVCHTQQRTVEAMHRHQLNHSRLRDLGLLGSLHELRTPKRKQVRIANSKRSEQQGVLRESETNSMESTASARGRVAQQDLANQAPVPQCM